MANRMAGRRYERAIGGRSRRREGPAGASADVVRRQSVRVRWLCGATVALCAAALMAPAGAAGQGAEEAVMIAAGSWVLEQTGEGDVRLDPHRTGQGTDRRVLRRVASALGADLGTLEETRHCSDPMDPSTCRLDADVLLCIAPPRVRGDEAEVRAYAWTSADELRNPVQKRTWALQLERVGDEWRVVSKR